MRANGDITRRIALYVLENTRKDEAAAHLARRAIFGTVTRERHHSARVNACGFTRIANDGWRLSRVGTSYGAMGSRCMSTVVDVGGV